ncbi:conserved hypothetical protein [Magnetospirillum sp. LM-5]|uniref:phosphotransferase family protein n=1 Tax=Magnetospirillum sp. LM-5 TaxID=2681466 RepID=UPI00137F2E04|nr:phosphotransferase [Magnetospirillum sp. LM-5]CAA7615934.1 conserved hypothetical protein [Magnetospirillum sp. LM-5]
MNVTQARDLAAGLLGRPVDAAQAVGRGGNNRIFAIDAGTERLALKSYPPQAEDPRDRLGQEWQALSFLAGHGLPVPQPVAADPARHAALYTWIDGRPLEPADDAVAAMGAFFARLQALRGAAADMREGSTPVFAAEQAERQFAERLAPLAGTPALAAHLADIRGSAERAFARARAWLGAGFATPSARVLSPSDFGRHNMLAAPSGLAFLDFEYFGWDGPEKAIADAMLHPGSAFSAPERDRLKVLMLAALPDDPGLAPRLEAMIPLFGLIWCLILLNEFRPDRRARRGLVEGSAEARLAESRQLEKSRSLLSWLEDAHDLAPA